jgi:hypothetical protein
VDLFLPGLFFIIGEKETPGTWRYKENKEDHPMTNYLTKEQVKVQ